MTYQVEIIYFYVLQTENAAFLGGNREKESCKIFKASEYFERLLYRVVYYGLAAYSYLI